MSIDSSLKQVRCITFDLDDTLWECAPVIRRAEDQFYCWLDSRFPKVTEQFSYTELLNHRIAYMRSHSDELHNLTKLRKNWLREVAEHCGYNEDLVEPGFSIFWQARNQVELFNDVESTLERLGKNYLIGAITNGNANVEKIGIGHLFDFVVTSEEANVSKPNNIIFKAAADKAGVDISAILHVGDDPIRDVLGAIDAGALAAWVKGDADDWCEKLSPHIVVSHIRELLVHFNLSILGQAPGRDPLNYQVQR